MKKISLLLSAAFIGFLTSTSSVHAKSPQSTWYGKFTSKAVLSFPGESQKFCNDEYEGSRYDSESSRCVLESKEGNSIEIQQKDWQVEVVTIFGPANQRMFTGKINSVYFGSNGITTIKSSASEASAVEEGDISASGSGDCEELTIELSKHQSIATVILPQNPNIYCDSRLEITGKRKK